MAQEPQPEGSGSGISFGDIYHVLFRHKWMIILCSVAGILGAGKMYLQKPSYRSTAKLLVRYVPERKAITSGGEGDQIKAPDSAPASIMNTEIEILTSSDLAEKVAEAIGPEKILGTERSDTNLDAAARALRNGLRTDLPGRSQIIEVSYGHTDPGVAEAVLLRLIAEYQKKTFEIHRAAASFEFLTNQTQLWKDKLAATEEELRDVKTQTGVISPEETRKTIAAEMILVRQGLLEAEERKSTLGSTAVPGGRTTQSNELGSASQRLPNELVLREYRSLCAQLELLHAREIELLGRLTTTNPLVIAVREQISEYEKTRNSMLALNPGLTSIEIAIPSTAGPSNEMFSGVISLAALDRKIQFLTNRLEKLKEEAMRLDAVEDQFTRLTRRRQIEEENFRKFFTSLEQARLDTALDAGKISSVTIAQAPSSPVRDRSALRKPAAMSLAAGVLGGMGLAFLLELFLDPRVRRPVEVESKLRLPLRLSIPDFGWKRNIPRDRGPRQRGVRKKGVPPVDARERASAVALWDPHHALRPFYEALRDRVLMQFEGIARRPKLVGLTSCSTGSGVTTLATGLAAALSETGQGKVLLVDMNGATGAAHPFFHGEPACGLAAALENSKDQPAAFQGNLVLASVNPHPVLSRTLLEVMPKLKASDYDYVIFDLPPISQTSVTLRLAGYMDEVMIVAEAGKTHRSLLQKAFTLVTQAQANASTILNKHRNYVPRALQQEL